MDASASEVSKFCYVRQPLLVGRIRVKLPVQIVLCHIFWVRRAPCTAFSVKPDRRLYMQHAIHAQNAFVVDVDGMVPIQFIPDSAVAHVGVYLVNLFHLPGNALILQFALTLRLPQPLVVGGASDAQDAAQQPYRPSPFLRKRPDGLVFTPVASQA